MSGWERWLMKNWPQKLTRKRKGEDKSFKSSFILKYKLVATDSSSVKKQEKKNRMKSGAKKGVTMFVYDSHVWSDQLTIKGGSHNNKVFQFSMKQNIKESWMSFLRLCRPQWAGWVKIYERHVTTASAQVSSPNRPRCATQDFFLFCSSEPSHRNSHAEHSATHRCFLRPAQLINIICCVYIDPPLFLSQPTPTASFQRKRKEKKKTEIRRER